MRTYIEKLRLAAEIREFYTLAEKYGFTEGNPEIEGYIKKPE